jgi:hypothetical protein
MLALYVCQDNVRLISLRKETNKIYLFIASIVNMWPSDKASSS